jgi:hypothetical protein
MFRPILELLTGSVFLNYWQEPTGHKAEPCLGNCASYFSGRKNTRALYFSGSLSTDPKKSGLITLWIHPDAIVSFAYSANHGDSVMDANTRHDG